MKGHAGYVRVDEDAPVEEISHIVVMRPPEVARRPGRPRKIGKLEAQVEALQSEVHAMRGDIKQLLEMANKSKGGFWVGMSIASALGGVITFVADRLFLKG